MAEAPEGYIATLADGKQVVKKDGAWVPYEKSGRSMASSILSGAMGIPSAAATVASSAIAQPVAGLAGLLTGNPDNVGAVQNAMTMNPTENGRTALSGLSTALSPLTNFMNRAGEQAGYWGAKGVGAIGGGDKAQAVAYAAGKTLPTAVSMLPIAGPAKAAQSVEELASQAAQDLPQSLLTPPKAAPLSHEEILTAIGKKKAPVVADAINPNPAVLDAAKRQNIDLIPSAYSQNPTYVDLERALKSAMPSSGLQAKEQASIQSLNDRAGELVNQMGGSIDRSTFDSKLTSYYKDTINSIKTKAGELFNKVDEQIPAETRVELPATKSYITTLLDKLGGDEASLSAPEKRVLAIVNSNQAPTYGNLARVKHDIGQAFDGMGVYKDLGDKNLNDLYQALKNDQLSIAGAHGVGDNLSTANGLTTQYKNLQDASKAFYGNKLDGSVNPQVRNAALGLTKGNSAAFDKLIGLVPAELKSDAAASVVNDILTSGSRSDQVGGGFATAFTGLKKNVGAYDKLKSAMTPEAAKRFDDLGTIATGIFNAAKRENTSGTARAMGALKAIDDPSVWGKLWGVSKEVVGAEAASTAAGFPGVGTGLTIIKEVLSKPKGPATQAADAFIASPALQQAIHVAATDPKIADIIVQKSPQFAKWATTMTPADQARIGQVGFFGWLSSPESQQQ